MLKEFSFEELLNKSQECQGQSLLIAVRIKYCVPKTQAIVKYEIS